MLSSNKDALLTPDSFEFLDVVENNAAVARLAFVPEQIVDGHSVLVGQQTMSLMLIDIAC